MSQTNALCLAEPSAFELRTISTLAAPLLVVAPHPDDETLGCGGAIALLQSQPPNSQPPNSQPPNIHILVISDGTQSHPNSQRYPAAKLRALRQNETLRAMKILGVANAAVSFLNLPDTQVPQIGSSGFAAAVRRAQTYLASLPLKTILLPWRYDPHCDHQATYQIIKAAADPAIRLVEYPIWDWDSQQTAELAGSVAIAPWRLDIHSVVALNQQAISAYRSQTTRLIDDDPTGFQLSAQMLKHFQVPWEVFIEEIA
ncbi:MAG: PIG-L family deacetylase [Phormidesmis sp.]